MFLAHMCDPDRLLNSPLSGKLQESQVLVNGQIYQIAASTMGKGLVLKSLDLGRFRSGMETGRDTGVIDCSERVCTNILLWVYTFRFLKISSTTGDFLEHQPDNLTTWKGKKKTPFLR